MNRFTSISITGLAGCAVVFAAFAACSDEAGPGAKSTPTPDGGPAATPDAGEAFNAGEELKIPVPATGRVYVKLTSPPAVVTPADPATDKTWDLAFEGADVFTNSGPSGSGACTAFGPLDSIVFIEDTAPDVPFLSPDKTGGAFTRWYFYEGAPNHALYSRFHVFGVKDGDKLYRVQVLGYYGRRDGAPISALYKLRYAEVGQPAKEAIDIDGTAGGTAPTAASPSECIDLGTGQRMMLTPEAARNSSAWHLCFRRQDIAVNGELGGPRNAGAIDFEAEKVSVEKIDEVVERTPESTLGQFDAVNAQTFEGKSLRGDRIISAFSGLWTEQGAKPLQPGKSAWLVVGADGKKRYLLGFPRFEGATDTGPGTVVMRVKAAK